ncbi:MAG TPA: hypothetical protein VJ804_07060 [Acidimicrobiales bacterium]|nr:hypothetical protein [Acidimicrobiales bacterium]
MSDTTPSVGDSVSFSCAGFAPGTSVAVDLLSDPVRLTSVTANAQGVASGAVLIPLNTTTGAHTVRFTGTAPDGSSLVKSVAITVDRQLPRTGTNTWTIFRYAVLLMGLGLLATGRSQLIAARD